MIGVGPNFGIGENSHPVIETNRGYRLGRVIWHGAAEISGVLRGMLQSGVVFGAGVKVGDVDPRGERGYCDTISDKARAIGGGVVEAIFHSYQRLKNPAT